jgi:hypothetical protein
VIEERKMKRKWVRIKEAESSVIVVVSGSSNAWTIFGGRGRAKISASTESFPSTQLRYSSSLSMLKSTFQKTFPSQETAQSASGTDPELLPGWTAHVAPSGISTLYCIHWPSEFELTLYQAIPITTMLRPRNLHIHVL